MCFCGCGQTVPKFPLGVRSVNTRGRQVAERLAYGLAMPGDAEDFANWLEGGTAILVELRAAVHGDLDPRAVSEPAVRHWQAYGQNIERGAVTLGHPSIREWLRENQEAVAAVARA